MSVFVISYSLIFTALLAALSAVMPTIMPPELPLGVRVPSAHQGDPVIRRALRRFRLAQLPAWVITAILTVALAPSVPVVAASVPLVVFVALSIAAYVLARRSIVRAKRDGAWFDGLPVRLRADVAAPQHPRPPVIWPILAVMVLAGTAALGVSVYPGLPDPYPTHFDIAGTVTSTAPKSIWSVFGVLLVAAAVTLLLAALSVVASRGAVRPISADDTEQAAARARVQRGLTASLLSELSFVVALGLSAILVAQWLAPSALAISGGAILLTALILIVVIGAVLRMQRAARAANRRDPQAQHADAPDDDRHWKGGVLYLNRDDPSMFVPKRFGIGWTINLASPAGAGLGILLLLIIAGSLVAAFVSRP